MGSWDIPYTYSASTATGLNNAGSNVLGFRAWMDNTQSVCKIEFYTNENTDHRFGIFDLLGRKLVDAEYHATTGKNYLEIPMVGDKFSSGIYILRSTCDSAKAIKLFLH